MTVKLRDMCCGPSPDVSNEASMSSPAAVASMCTARGNLACSSLRDMAGAVACTAGGNCAGPAASMCGARLTGLLPYS